jgi:AraC family transcriptional regulator
MKDACGYSPITLGVQIRTLEAGGFMLTETRHESAQKLEPHRHEYANLLCVLSGEYREHTGKGSVTCEPSGVLLKPAGEMHSDEYGRNGAHCLIIEIKPTLLKIFRSLSTAFSKVTYIEGSALSAIGARIYRELRKPHQDSSSVLEGLVLEMMTEILHQAEEAKAVHGRPEWLSEARDFIHEHYLEPVSLYDVAAAASVHPAHMARMFRRYYQTTVGSYIRSLRLEFAAKKLAASNDSILDIALSSGFYDQSHFTNEFKAKTGLTPSHYRRTFRKNSLFAAESSEKQNFSKSLR